MQDPDDLMQRRRELAGEINTLLVDVLPILRQLRRLEARHESVRATRLRLRERLDTLARLTDEIRKVHHAED